MPIQRKDRRGKKRWFGRLKLPDGKLKEKAFSTKEQAVEWEVLAKRRLNDFSATGTVSLLTLAERYLDHVEVRLSRQSYTEKQRVFRLLFDDIRPETSVDDVSYAQIEGFLNRISKKVSGYSANRYRTHLVRSYNWGIRALKLPAPNPWLVERYKTEKRPRHIPQEEEFWDVYDAAPADKQRLLLTFLHTAGRKNEIFGLKWEDVDFDSRKVRLWTSKRKGGREYNWIPMTDDLLEALKEQRLHTGFNEFVFVSPKNNTRYTSATKMMAQLCARAGCAEFGFHGIRHLTASILDAQGLPLSTIQAILRHCSSHTTAKYLHDLRGVKVELNAVLSGRRTNAGSAREVSSKTVLCSGTRF